MSFSLSKTEAQSVSAAPPRRPIGRVLLRMLENFIVDTSWKHVAYKLCAYSYLTFILWITWHVSPFSNNWVIPRQTDGVPIVHQDFAK